MLFACLVSTGWRPVEGAAAPFRLDFHVPGFGPFKDFVLDPGQGAEVSVAGFEIGAPVLVIPHYLDGLEKLFLHFPGHGEVGAFPGAGEVFVKSPARNEGPIFVPNVLNGLWSHGVLLCLVSESLAAFPPCVESFFAYSRFVVNTFLTKNMLILKSFKKCLTFKLSFYMK